eukprot:m.543521 g.543521  ORF g.543521 m.543521 type:complete len:667 (-) comp22129_c2_seq1:676-2676(-)
MEPVQEDLVLLASNPARFLEPQETDRVQVLSSLQAIFGQVKLVEPSPSPLEKLLVDGFDVEQIWEQIQLVNTPLLAHVAKDVSRIVDGADSIVGSSASLYRSAAPSEQDADDIARDAEDVDDEESDDDVDESENDVSDENPGGADDDEDIDADSDGDAKDQNDESIESASAHGKKLKTGKEREDRNKTSKKGNRSAVDDDFFRLSDMQSFLDAEDAREMRRNRKLQADTSKYSEDEDTEEDDDDDDLNEIDMFGNIGDEDEDETAKSMTYSEFFGDRRSGPNRAEPDNEDDFEDVDVDGDVHDDSSDVSDTAEAAEDSDADLVDKGAVDMTAPASDALNPAEMSRFQRQQLRMREEIAKLEEVNVGDKPWQLAGEVQAGARPLDSLLQEDLDFDVTTAPAPDITEEVTQSLEDTIKQRIRDHVFDDVERKVDPKRLGTFATSGSSKVELNSEQSSVGLGDIYADEFQRKANNITTSAAEEKLSKEHEEIDGLLGSLYQQLNALTNFNYTPRAAEIEVQTISNIPAIAMEEATPGARDGGAGAGGATRLAPEEVHDKKKKDGGVAKADDEKSKTDKKRERRAKKKAKHLKRVAEETKEREKANAGVQMSKKTALKKLAGNKNTTIIKGDRKRMSSAAVFKELGQPAAENPSTKKRKKEISAGSAFRL